MARVAVCEPDGKLADRIETLIEKANGLLNEKLEVEVYTSGGDFIKGLEQGEMFQIVYMNLDMGGGDGIEFGRRLRERFNERVTLLVYISAETSFSGQIFEVQPFLIINPSFEDKEFTRKLFMAVEHIQEADELFVIKQGRTVHQVRKRDVICLESIGREIIMSVHGRDDIQYREALKNEWGKLRTINFIRPHNSYVANLDFVEEYRSDSLLLKGGRIIPISELKMKEVKKEILKFWEYRNI